MKNKILLISVALFTSVQMVAETHRVNSDGYGAAFTNLQTAIDAAVAGDTLHIEGTMTGYGNAVMDKELHLFGPGYFLTENLGLQARVIDAVIVTLTLDNGAEGSTVSGLWFSGQVVIRTGDITIRRNRINEVRLHDGGAGAYSNVVLIQNWIYSPVWHVGGAAPTLTDLMILNCFLGNDLGLAPSVSGTVANCIFNGATCSVYNADVFNNIILVGGVNQNNSTFHHNIVHDGGLPAGNNNQLNVDMATVFVASGTTDGIMQLAAGSPALGTGVNGEDIGMYGGATPYRLSGIPAIPTVYEYNVPATAIEGATINVTISTRTND